MSKEPTRIQEPSQPYGEDLYIRIPINMTFDPDLTLTDHLTYQMLDFLSGSRGWWYGTQEEILGRAINRFIDISEQAPKTAINFSVTSIQRSVKKLRDKGYIVTEKMGLTMNNLLKYYVVFRKPKLPPDFFKNQ